MIRRESGIAARLVDQTGAPRPGLRSLEFGPLLKRIALGDEARVERDALIAHKRSAGATWAELAEQVGMSEQATRDAARRGNGGKLPQPTAPQE